MAANESYGIWNLREINKGLTEARYYSAAYDIELLLVGGGGPGGSWNHGGGGGGGGVVYANALPVKKGCTYNITVGAGGVTSGQNINTLGANTTFCYAAGSPLAPAGTLVTAWGGGGGGQSGGLPGQYFGAIAGGSGGGEGSWIFPTAGTGSNPLNCPRRGSPLQNNPTLWGGLPAFSGFGNCGGLNNHPVAPSQQCAGGGGGGAGGCGCDASSNPATARPAGNGGPGLTYTISGSTCSYAGGGAGGISFVGPASGSFGADGGGDASWPGLTPVPGGNPGSYGPCPGQANRGGGGASTNNYSGAAPPSSGGSGIAIIRYTGTTRGTGGNTVVTCNTPTTRTSHIFTGSGCFLA